MIGMGRYPTMSTLFLFVGAFTCSLLVHAFFLWVGAKVVKIPHLSYRRALGTFCLVVLVQFVIQFVVFVSSTTLPNMAAWISLSIWVAVTVAVLLVSWLIIGWMFRTTYVKAILAWLPTPVATGLMLAFVFLIIKPFAAEAFIVSNNSMAPTLIGPHYLGNCPHCAETCILQYDTGRPTATWDEIPGICPHCFETVRAGRMSPEPGTADRFICNKWITPQRWDMVVFRSLDDPTHKRLKRLVGLPGEEIRHLS